MTHNQGCAPKNTALQFPFYEKERAVQLKFKLIDNPQVNINIPAPWIRNSRHRTSQADLWGERRHNHLLCAPGMSKWKKGGNSVL
jgi:hypothetical protein